MGRIPDLREISTRMNPETISQLLQNGRGTMPAFGHLEEEKREAIVDFLSGIDRKNIVEQKVTYVSSGYNRFLDDNGYPAISPPWGLLTAIDLDKQQIAWQVPLGEYEELTKQGIPQTGTENYGGPVVTSTGLTFIAATADEKIRAFDSQTGRLLWEESLPAGGYATPSIYEAEGHQYLIIACGGNKAGTKAGDSYVTFRLPQAVQSDSIPRNPAY